tara:strand:+ start:2565 stop:3296 length:732 start_codon:yes stop_codon:yes gene_type:complete
MATRNYQSYMGPTDPNLRHSEIEGYQPVSRIGEVVINSFIDSYEFTALPEYVTVEDVEPPSGAAEDERTAATLKMPFEHKPHFHEWATALPGMICVSRKARNSTFRNYVAAETATPVISCCACLGADDMKNFYFAGVARSKSVRPIDDGVGPQIDEFFTLAIGGMCTLLNNSGTVLYPGDMLEWCFYNQKSYSSAGSKGAARGNSNPRRITVKIATTASERVIGRALSFAKPGETFDLLLKSC